MKDAHSIRKFRNESKRFYFNLESKVTEMTSTRKDRYQCTTIMNDTQTTVHCDSVYTQKCTTQPQKTTSTLIEIDIDWTLLVLSQLVGWF